MFPFLPKNKLKILTRDLFLISTSLFLFFLFLSQSNPEQIGYSIVYKIFGISSITSLILMFRHQILHFLKTDPNPQIKTILGDLSLISLIIFAIFSWINYTNPIYTQTTETLTNPEALQSTSKLIPGTFVFLIISLTSLILFLKDKIHRNFDEFLKYGFLISLLTVTLSSLNFEFIQTAPFLNNIVTFLKTYLLPISIISITFGFFLFYRNRETINLEIEKEESEEKQAEQTRLAEFPTKFPKINKIPLLRGIIKWGYKEGWKYVFFLILIISVFVLIRSQSLNIPWEHTANYDKIRSQLPGAINAYLNNDFFHEENNFYGFVDNYGLRNYSSFPLYQWILYPFMSLTNSISIFTIIKLIMLFIDVIIIIALFVLFKKILKNKKFALIGVLFVSVNIYFQIYLATPVTDRFALLFFIFGIILLDQKKYFWSYLLAGLSFLTKESFFFIVIPFYITFELYSLRKEPTMKAVNRIFVNLPAIILPYVLFQILIKKLPTTSDSLRIVYITICILIFCGFYFFSKNNFNFKKPEKRFLTMILLFLMTIFGFFLYYIMPKALSLSSNFLTDRQILFNWDMYKILIYQFASLFEKTIWIFLILGIISNFIFSKKNILLKSLFATSLVYLIIVSKAIAMHQYYRHIFMIIFLISLLTVLKFFHSTKIKRQIFVIFLLTIGVILLNNYKITANKIYEAKNTPNISGLEEAGLYLRKNLNKEVNILYGDYELYGVTIFNSFHNPCHLNKKIIRNEVKKTDLEKVLKKYNCTYYLSIGESDFTDFIDYYIQIKDKNAIPRSELISYRTSEDFPYKNNKDESFDTRSYFNNKNYSVDINEENKKYNPRQYFKLEKVIGDIYIYKVSFDQ